MLQLEHLACGHHGSVVLREVNLTITPGEVVALLGRNGVGKTTLISTVIGMLPATAGTIRVDGRAVGGWPAWRIAREGIAMIPQGRRLWAPLSVEEHLTLATRSQRRTGPWNRDTVLDLFGPLRDRLRHRPDQLSGGEQQMLSISRALLTNPRLLLLDEPSDGLAPSILATVSAAVTTAAQQGCAVLLAEQHLPLARALADHILILDRNTIAARPQPADLDDPDHVRALLGV